VQLDDLVATPSELPDQRTVVHYGIVTELFTRLEGAELPSDTARVAERILPAQHVRRAEVTLLRTQPELFLAPNAGAGVLRAAGDHRALALFEDQMQQRLPVGLDLTGQPVHADMKFVDGRAGGHVSISGVSGVATKTSYALFLLYQLLETEAGIDLLGGLNDRNQVRALVFNTKGEDLLHLDRANARWAEHPDAAGQWARLGVPAPGPFSSVRLYAPRADSQAGSVVANVRTRGTTEVNAYGWTPEQFVRQQLLQFCFTAEDERSTQVGMVEQQVRVQLLRRLWRLADDHTGAIVVADAPHPDAGYNPDRLADREPEQAQAFQGAVVRSFDDLIDLLERAATATTSAPCGTGSAARHPGRGAPSCVGCSSCAGASDRWWPAASTPSPWRTPGCTWSTSRVCTTTPSASWSARCSTASGQRSRARGASPCASWCSTS
jgi:hypothetical protein